MSQVLTVSCKLEVLPQQVEKLDAVLSAFAKCCEFVNANTPEKKNIATLGLLVNQPGGSEAMSCSLQDVVLRAAESSALYRAG